MSTNMSKKMMLKKTVQFGGATFLSRLLGIVREFLFVRFLGIGAISDAFLTSLKIPYLLRRIFAEGALSAAFVPPFIKKIREGEKRQANSLMSASFLFFEGLVFFLCLFVVFKTRLVIKFAAPGFNEEQIAYAVPFLKILFPLIFFISSSALFAAALQSVNHFFIPSFAPAMLNIATVSSLLICLKYNLNPLWLCFGVLIGGFFIFLSHFIFYLKYNFSFGSLTRQSFVDLKFILKKFALCLIGIGIVEINLFIDTMIGSLLPKGSVSLLHYGGRFMNIPLGIFAVSFSSILLSQFSRVALYAKSRFKFYLLEVSKFITFVIVPAMLFLIFASEKIFSILMFGKKATLEQVMMAKKILIIYCLGLVFFALNKILLNMFYSLKDTFTPTIALAISTVVNFAGNMIGIRIWGIYGIPASTVFSALVLTLVCFIFLKSKHNISFYSANYFNFVGRYLFQVLIAIIIFVGGYFGILRMLSGTVWYDFFTASWGYWIFVFSLLGTIGLFIFLSRKFFGLKLYFLSK